MRKLFGLALGMAMAASLTACGSGNQGGAAQTTAKAEETTQKEASAETTAADAKADSSADIDYPTKDITIIVPFDAGGGNDILARLISKTAMEGKYFKGANIIVENQPGGGGAIGQAYVAKTAPADGYTLLTYTASAISNPILKQVPFTVDDFKIVICPNTDPVVMIARKDAPFNTVDEMLEYAKDNKLIINDSGFGTSTHVRTLDWTQKMKEQKGIDVQYDSVHVDSGNVQISELMGGHADLTCLTAGECADAILSGNVKALGIMTEERLEGLPDVPTFKEQGYDGFIDGADRAIACATDVPDDIYQYLCDKFTKLCSSDEFIKAMKDANLTPACESGDEYQAFVDRKTDLFNSLKDYLLAGEK